MVHAIGDRAVEQFVNLYPKVFSNHIPDNPKAHSIEHVEIIDDELLWDIKNLGIIISAQPNFAGRWSVPGGLNEKRLGDDRLRKCNPYKKFFDYEIPIVFGSDSMPLNPIFGIKSAIFHPVAEQRITPERAIRAYTQNCYKIFNFEPNLGSIEPGKIADLVILTSDPFVMGEQSFDRIQVAGTIINGELVYSKL
jgi:predicted amidohydrolase YtcJ